ncbi:type 2 periplasmic-binding domain-containing protein [Cohnella abietis]|uniref:extracellular solute-binding protein n=1 Tax=Cohnella abietis TaxID=2507935 RepID=UPI001300B4BE|nr:extracellular solute-binding protein [Cohnella abietis]
MLRQTKKTRTSAIVIFMLVLVLVVSACGKKENAGQPSESSGTPASETSAASPSASAANEEGPWSKYEKPLKVTTALKTNTGITQLDKDTYDDNLWTRAIESTFNIKMENLWTADATQYTTKLNVSIASGNLPDVYTVDNVQFAQVTASGLNMDLMEAYEKFASPELRKIMEADKAGFESGIIDGKLMGISTQHFGMIAVPSVVWIRDDWMKKFNLAPPKTMDELLHIAEVFKTENPDGNKKNDTYGIAINKNLYDTSISATGVALADGIFNAYHAYPAAWIKDASGKIVYGSVQPEMKAGLAVLQDMFKKGLISKEFGLKDTAKIAEDLTNGKVGIEIGSNWNGYYPGPDIIKKNGNGAILMPYAIPSGDGQPVKQPGNWPVGSYIVVNKKFANPEAAIKLINLYVKINQTNDADEYINFTAGGRMWNAPIGVSDPDQSAREYTQISQALETKDTSKLAGSSVGKYSAALKWVESQDPDSAGAWLQNSSVGSFSVLQKLFDNGNVLPTEYRGVDTPTMAEKKATLEKLEKEAITKIIMGASLDEFDKMVSNWNKLGGEAITQEMNDKYNK